MKKLTCCDKTDENRQFLMNVCEIGLSLYLSLCLSFHFLIHQSPVQTSIQIMICLVKWPQTNQPWMSRKKKFACWIQNQPTLRNIQWHDWVWEYCECVKKGIVVSAHMCNVYLQTCMWFKLHFLAYEVNTHCDALSPSSALDFTLLVYENWHKIRFSSYTEITIT